MRCNKAAPLADHIVQSFTDKFPYSSVVTSSFFDLSPSLLTLRDVDLEQAITERDSDLQSPELRDPELR